MTPKHDALGIRTAEGKQIYDAAVRRSGNIQEQRAEHELGSEEFERLTKLDKGPRHATANRAAPEVFCRSAP
jgi:hypothetical protein